MLGKSRDNGAADATILTGDNGDASDFSLKTQRVSAFLKSNGFDMRQAAVGTQPTCAYALGTAPAGTSALITGMLGKQIT